MGRVSFYGLLRAEHSVRFEPNRATPGETTFVPEEEYRGVLAFMIWLGWPWRKRGSGLVGSFNRDLKISVESLKLE
jgi:hypothetical protein